MKRLLRSLGSALVAFLLVGYIAADRLNAADKSPVVIKVTVAADAVIEIDGVKTKQTGTARTFVTPDLEKGKKYSYLLKATFTQNGKPVTIERTVVVEPGKETELDLTQAEATVKAEPKKEEAKKEQAKKEESKKEEPKTEVRLDVPYVPTPEPVVEAMLKLANVSDKDVVYDLGCGDGRIVIAAVKKYKAKKGVGIEIFPDRVKLSKENAKKAGVDVKVDIREGSVLDLTDVSEASVVTLYLLPDINLKLMPMLKGTLKPGSRIVSHDFNMGDWKADKEISMKDNDGREHTIFLWTIAAGKAVETKKDVFKKEEPKKEIAKKEEPKKDEKTIVVPYVPTPQKVVDAMLKLANIKEGEVIYDLGCGDGRILVTAAQKYKASGWGLDLNPERVKESEENAKKAKVDNRLAFAQGDVLKLKDVSEANVVTLYLLPEVNRRLAPVLKKTLKPGSRIVSHDFDMGDWKEDKKIEVTDDEGVGHTLYLWTIK